MTEEFELHRYCTGIDCAWCLEPEPSIYKIANILQSQWKEKEQENQKIKEALNDIKEIAERECYLCRRFNDDGCYKFCNFNKILQKIKEIEDYE